MSSSNTLPHLRQPSRTDGEWNCPCVCSSACAPLTYIHTFYLCTGCIPSHPGPCILVHRSLFPPQPDNPSPKFTRVQQKSSAVRCADWSGIYKYIRIYLFTHTMISHHACAGPITTSPHIQGVYIHTHLDHAFVLYNKPKHGARWETSAHTYIHI